MGGRDAGGRCGIPPSAEEGYSCPKGFSGYVPKGQGASDEEGSLLGKVRFPQEEGTPFERFGGYVPKARGYTR